MRNIWMNFHLGITGIGGWVGWQLGGVDGFVYTLIALVCIDYLTGVMAAILEGKLSSELGFRGIFKKVLIFILVAIANMVDVYLIKNGSAIRTAVIFFYISNEGISILENASKIGLPIPENLKSVLLQINKEDNKDGN